jgi:glycosyltransferase involved in cell wall biosynthesis
MHNNTLVVFLSDYPFGYGEPFFERELKILEKNYARIILVLTVKTENQEQLFHVGPTTEIIHLNNIVTKNTNIFHFSIWAIIRELMTLFALFKLKPSKSLVADIVYYEKIKSRFYPKIKQLIKDNTINLNSTTFYTYWLDQSTYSLIYFKRKHPRLKMVSRTHGWDLYFERHPTNYLPFRLAMLEKIDKVISISKQGENYLKEKLKSVDNKITTSYLGVEENDFNQWIYDQKTLYIVSLSFLSPVKNIETLIAYLRQVNYSVNWVHIGGGEEKYEKTLKEMAKESLEHNPYVSYNFKGTLNKDEIKSYLVNEKIDLLINTSHSEGLPVSIMEAFSSGIPVIAPDIGGVKEIIDDTINGYVLSKVITVAEIEQTISNHIQKKETDMYNMKKNALEKWKNKFNSEDNFTTFIKIIQS